MWSRAQLKSHAKEVLRLGYWKAVLVSLILTTIIGGSSASSASSNYRNLQESDSFSQIHDWSSADTAMVAAIIGVVFATIFIFLVVGIIIRIFAFNPIIIGCQRYFVKSLKDSTSLKTLGFGFSNSYLNIVKILFLQNLFISLWSILLIIPGIIKSYEYRMIPYILAENPEMDSKSVFARSKAMMNGEKLDAWVLDLSFIGWYLLSICTCGLLSVFYVAPYKHITNAELYNVLKQKIDGVSYNEAQTIDNSSNPYIN